ncbi:Uncharacterised protein [uncultured archaeon]|nr:Uncharacterised protein [uncultured archaeon]
MAQLFKKTLLATAAAASFVGMSIAEEPLKLRPVEIVQIDTANERSDENTKIGFTLVGLLVVLGAGAYAMTRKRSMFGDDPKGDRSEDDVWKS